MQDSAWAKINLALHVRARRSDGYHDIETLFAFVDNGDRLTAERASADSLEITGAVADGLSSGPENLVLRALIALRRHFGAGRVPTLAIVLDKQLPVAAGLGGGSADAAALARLVRRHFLPEVSDAALARVLGPLGADIGACIGSTTCFGRGTGAALTPLSDHSLVGTAVLLVNPRQPLGTGPVFAAWDGIDRGTLYTDPDLRAQLFAARNDLQRPAIAQCPAIVDVLTALGGLQPWLVRMSGSGASCFALFDAPAARDRAALALGAQYPDWWMMAGSLR